MPNDDPSDAPQTDAADAPSAATDTPSEPIPAWEADLDVYPERPASDDPRWALRIVWTWTGFAILSLVFILVLLVLGLFYD